MGAIKKIIDQHQKKEELKKSDSKLTLVSDDIKNYEDKKDIERMKKLLNEKIKDPSLAKKAALIIADMIKGKGEK